ncbi:MAG: hypothetical protein HOV78_11690 [Hamadaea sp.]|nr:hypothetical protein [Hamadaea sp.]
MPALPIHPTKRHPLTGEPLRALWVRPDGRVCWPMMGGAPDGDDDGGSGGSGDSGDGSNGGAGGNGSSGSGTGNAVDDKGNDLGYPANTRVAEMTDAQAAAYWRHQSQKHEGRYKNLTGDRSFDDVRKDLDDIAEIRKQQQTPAEQAIEAAREEGRTSAINEANNKAATAIFRASLKAQGHSEDDINDLVDNFNVANFVKDGDVDTDKLATFAQRFTPAGTAKKRDFGGGDRGSGRGTTGSAGQAALERRHGVKTTTTGS